MKVLPDAIPFITPVIDLQVAFGEGDGIGDHGGEAGTVTPGCFVPAEKVSLFILLRGDLALISYSPYVRPPILPQSQRRHFTQRRSFTLWQR